MIFFGFLALCGIISFLSFRSKFYLMKLLAGAAWIAFFVFWMYSPIGGITQGSPPHIAVMVVIVGVAIAIPILGLGREIDTQTDWRTGAKTERTGMFKFKIPDWLRGEETVNREKRSQDVEDYRERMHRALHPNKKERR